MDFSCLLFWILRFCHGSWSSYFGFGYIRFGRYMFGNCQLLLVPLCEHKLYYDDFGKLCGNAKCKCYVLFRNRRISQSSNAGSFNAIGSGSLFHEFRERIFSKQLPGRNIFVAYRDAYLCFDVRWSCGNGGGFTLCYANGRSSGNKFLWRIV